MAGGNISVRPELTHSLTQNIEHGVGGPFPSPASVSSSSSTSSVAAHDFLVASLRYVFCNMILYLHSTTGHITETGSVQQKGFLPRKLDKIIADKPKQNLSKAAAKPLKQELQHCK